MAKAKQKIRKLVGIVAWAGVHNWKSGKGWHYRLKMVTSRVDQVVQIDCYKNAKLLAAGYVRETGSWTHDPQLQIQQGDRVEISTRSYKKETNLNKNNQRYTRQIYSLNSIREIKVLERIEAVPPPPMGNSSDSDSPAPPPA